jgi:mono/diheme cytochrome c family protein
MNARLLALALAAAAAVTATIAGAASTAPVPSIQAELVRGRALVVYGTCNDCHTAGWRDADGDVPVTRWMTGSSIGFRGWWGTSYPTNVRRDFQAMSEKDWIFAARTRAGHPPMVWQDLRNLPDADLRAIYRFVRALGPAGANAPTAVEPWREPTTPYVDMRALPSPAPGAR